MSNYQLHPRQNNRQHQKKRYFKLANKYSLTLFLQSNQDNEENIVHILNKVVESLQGPSSGVEQVNHTFGTYVAQQLDGMLPKKQKKMRLQIAQMLEGDSE